MVYVCIGFIIISVVLAGKLFLINQTIARANRLMEEIEKNPKANNQLKALTMSRGIEKLFYQVNQIYKKRQEERICYQRREEQIRREIENISHDLRTPLTSIIGFVELILDVDSTEKEKNEYLDIIGKRSRVLQGFIQDFYELSRIESNEFPLQYGVLEVQPIIKEVVVAYYQEFKKKNIQVDIQLEEISCCIFGDKVQFHRIINNLVLNALKYCSKTFMIHQFIKDGECIIEFMNDKNNLKEEELSYLFDRFYCGDTSRNSQSTGLGLPIAKVLTEKMKGAIDAKLVDEMFVISLKWDKSTVINKL